MAKRASKSGKASPATSGSRRSSSPSAAPVRYAVVGLGSISQIAVLPAFAHARSNSRLAALVSDDPVKLASLARKYRVPLTYSYDEYEECLRSGEIDAVYLGLPNSLHADYTIRAARAGIHVLCEKPMAVTEQECLDMIAAADESRVKLMIAYRLHFEAANLEALRIVRSGKIGDPRVFNSLFSMQVKEGNIRLKKELGGGTLYDIGIYCINASRALFAQEPLEVFGWSVSGRDRRFEEVDEMTTAILRFPEQRFASFTCSFGAAESSFYQLLGTRGSVRLDPAYDYSTALKIEVQSGGGGGRGVGKTSKKTFGKRDQFAAELLEFSRCIHLDRDPEPSGLEGLTDVHVIRSIQRSIDLGAPVALERFGPDSRPQPKQRIDAPPVREPELVRADSPSKD